MVNKTILNKSYSPERLAFISDTTHKRLAMEIRAVVDEIQESFGPLLPEVSYILDRISGILLGDVAVFEGEKVVATQCVFVPDELIYATGSNPVRLCSGSHAFDLVGQEVLPAKACPIVKANFGSMLTGILPAGIDPDFSVIPASCDQKRKLPELLTDDDKKVYSLEIPASKDSDEAIEYWHRVVDRLILELEKVGGKKLTRRRLAEAIAKVNRAQQAYRELDSIRKRSPVIFGSLVLLALNTYFFDRIESWTASMEKLNRALKVLEQEGAYVFNENRVRIFLSGAPVIFPNLKLPILVEQLGGLVVGDDFCSSTRMLNDTVAVDEWNLYDMIPAIADRYLKPCTCPSFTDNSDRIRNLIEAVKSSGAHGLVYHSLTGCYLQDLEYIRVNRAMEEAGIPVLFLETDYSGEDKGQLTTRIEAFIESIKAKQKISKTP